MSLIDGHLKEVRDKVYDAWEAIFELRRKLNDIPIKPDDHGYAVIVKSRADIDRMEDNLLGVWRQYPAFCSCGARLTKKSFENHACWKCGNLIVPMAATGQ